MSMQEVESKLVDHGIQPSLQRIKLAQYLLGKADHPTAEQIYTWAQKELGKISLATVYNTLSTFIECGLIQEFKFPHLDQVIYDCRMDHHFHFVDTKSQRLHDVDSGSLRVQLKLPKKFLVEKFDIVFKGVIED